MRLNEEHQLIQQTAHKFAKDYLLTNSAKWDAEKIFPLDAIRAMGKLGFLGMLLPEKWGGSDVGYLSYILAIEEIAAGDASCSTIVSVHNSVGCLPILQFGSADVQQKYLPRMASGELLGAFCLTEPQAGSDAANIHTTAQLKDDYYVLNGTKQFITAGKDADLAIVFAATDSSKGKKGISAFVVPTDNPGYQIARIEDKLGQHAAATAQLNFDNLRVPVTHRLGQEGEGYKIALSNLEAGRLGIAAQCIGIGRHAYEEALQYAKTRTSFNKPLIEHQAICFKLADMATKLTAAKQLLLHAVDLKTQNLPCLKEAAMAKWYASEQAKYICDEALQIHGGYGYLKDFIVEQLYRDIRVTTLYEGTSEIQQIIIGREISR